MFPALRPSPSPPSALQTAPRGGMPFRPIPPFQILDSQGGGFCNSLGCGRSEAGMSAAIAITRRDLTAGELRAGAARSREAQASRRMLAIALVLEGVDRKSAAETCGMDRQTLRDWVHRWDAEGLAGLANRRGEARPRRLDPSHVAELVSWLEAGPEPVVDGVVRWRRQDLARPDRGPVRGRVARADGRRVSRGAQLPAAVGAPAASEDRPCGPGTLYKRLPEAVAAALPEAARGKPLEISFQDEARVGPAGHARPGLGEAGHAATRAQRATPATSGPTSSARSAPSAAPRRFLVACPSPTPPR